MLSVYWDLITALGSTDRAVSKVSVEIALGKHPLTWDLKDAVVPGASGFSAA